MAFYRLLLIALLFAPAMFADIAGLKEEPEMTDFVHQMLQRIGLVERIPVVIDPKTKWCAYATATSRGQRYIAVNPNCVGALYVGGQIDWKARAVLLHEIGHHLAGHILTHGHSHTDELEADFHSGWANYHLGATLDEALTYYSMLALEGTASHPGRAARVEAATHGWQAAAGHGKAQIPPQRMKSPPRGWWQEFLRTPLPWASSDVE